MEYFNDEALLQQAGVTLNYMHNGLTIVSSEAKDCLRPVFINDYLVKELGYERDELIEKIGSDITKLIYISDIPRLLDALEDIDGSDHVGTTVRLITKGNKPVWYMLTIFKVRFEDEDRIAINYTNVHDLIGTQMRLESDNSKLLDILDSIPVGIAIFNIKNGKNTTLAINKHLLSLANKLGTLLDGNHRNWSQEELIMIFNQSIYAFCEPEDIGKVKHVLEDSVSGKQTDCRFKLRGSKPDNIVYVAITCVSRENRDGGRNYYVCFQNATEQERSRIELEKKQDDLYKLSYFDNLTGVHNRNAYNALLAACKIKNISNVGIAFCDLNGLKRVNDSLGHIYGDRMLMQFADILKAHIDKNYIYRISGDEFVVVLPNIGKNEFASLMTEIVQKLNDANDLASVGFCWKQTASDIRRHCVQAEEIMYVEKQRYYAEASLFTSKHHPMLAEKLMNELEAGDYKMFLQPKAGFDSSKALGAEALVRKVEKNGKVIPPYEFVPQLEKEKLIPQIDYFMLEEVCKFLAELKKKGKTDFVVSVNMSRITLVENNYIDVVSGICNKYDFNKNQLEFEITESSAILDHIRLTEYIQRIKNLDISVSIDDVGTEYSSLTMLLFDGIDYVKLDRSIIQQLGTEKAKILLEHIITMCHELGIKVLAEGVEDETAHEILKVMGCDLYQGYLLSKPIPADDFVKKFINV